MKSRYAILLLGGAPLVASAQFGTNLVVNGGAETHTSATTAVSDFAGWTRSGNVYVSLYSAFPITPDGTAPADLGQAQFYGGVPSGSGAGAQTSLTQSVSLGFGSAAIDAGAAVYDLSGYFIVRDQLATSDEDQVKLTLTFLDAVNSPITSAALGPYDGERYASNPALFAKDVGFLQSMSGSLPVGTRSAIVTQTYTRLNGSNLNTGMDTISFAVRPVPEPGSLATLALGIVAMSRRRARR